MKGLRVWLGLALAVLLALVPVVLAFAYTLPMQPPSPVMPCSPYWLCGQTDDAVNQAVLPQPTLLPHPGKSQPTPRQARRCRLRGGQKGTDDQASLQPASRGIAAAARL